MYEAKVFDLLTPERRVGSGVGGTKDKKKEEEKLHGTQLQLELEVAPGKASVESRCYWVRSGERVVHSAAEALKALQESLQLRHTASHALNDASSRSHCIFSLQVHRKREVFKLERVDRQEWRYILQPSKTTTVATRANLVDLAGSEDARETLSSGAVLREAGDINKYHLRRFAEGRATFTSRAFSSYPVMPPALWTGFHAWQHALHAVMLVFNLQDLHDRCLCHCLTLTGPSSPFAKRLSV